MAARWLFHHGDASGQVTKVYWPFAVTAAQSDLGANLLDPHAGITKPSLRDINATHLATPDVPNLELRLTTIPRLEAYICTLWCCISPYYNLRRFDIVD